MEVEHKCVSCPAGAPDYYFVFPRSEINRLRRVYLDPVNLISLEESNFTVSIQDSRGVNPQARSIYQFATKPTIVPVSLRYSSGYDMLHRDLERSHEIDHRLENCPERLHPSFVQMYTLATGWTTIKMPAVSLNQ